MTEAAATDNLIPRLEGRIAAAARDALRLTVRLCSEAGAPLYLVGGAMRDLILNRDGLDLDLTLEAEVAPIARALAAATSGRLVLHERFGTATVRGEGFELDLARSRRETYAHPGALPAVEPASLTEDLARRDFTINAVALRLTPPAGELVDPHGGLADLKNRLVRVLHETSFQDDATRILRAIRYAARLGFEIEGLTEAWLLRDLPYLNTLSADRLRRELTLILREPASVDAAALAAELGVLPAVHPLLIYHPFSAGRWREALAGHHYGPLDQLGFCFLIDPYDDLIVEQLDQRLNLTAPVLKALRDRVRLHADSAKLASATPAAAVEILDGRAPVAVWTTALLETDPGVREACFAYLDHWRHLRPHLSGKDLIAMGIAPGLAMGDLLRSLRLARLEGRVASREDEIGLVQSQLAERTDDHGA